MVAAAEARGAAECVYLVAGEMSENALKFAEKSNIRPLRGTEIVRLTAG
jgi:hypothetical protein